MVETERAQMRAEVARSLGAPQKQLSPKYFYDARGSALFDRITELPEYYLTRAERRLIRSFAQDWLARLHACTLVELGAGSGEKTRLLLDALPDGAVYVPVDISTTYLAQIEADIGADFPALHIAPARSDIASELHLPERLQRPLVVALIGSTIGNFDEAAAAALLRRTSAVLEPGDRFLLGVDLRKDAATIEAAYNDAQGVTAEFNLNVLHVLNRELDADFDTDQFEHRAFYDERLGRIEMHLVSRSRQRVHVPGAGAFDLEAGETIRTEISCKYDRTTVERMLQTAGMSMEEWVVDDGRYALVVAAPG
jgi:L-histidine Nalpha-methyltransferase